MSKRNDVMASIGARVLENGHRAVLALSGGRLGRRVAGMTTVELHTIGRTSGRRRSTLLSTPIFDDRRVIVVASKGGHDEHPDWYKNLVANPSVEITMHGQTRPMRARTAAAEEKAQLWPQIVRVYRGYAGYQKRSNRDIPVVVCEPVVR